MMFHLVRLYFLFCPLLYQININLKKLNLYHIPFGIWIKNEYRQASKNYIIKYQVISIR
jgi:hypothetical protein